MGTLLSPGVASFPDAVRRAIADMFHRAAETGLPIINVKEEAERIRTTMPEAVMLSPDQIARRILDESLKHKNIGLVLN